MMMVALVLRQPSDQCLQLLLKKQDVKSFLYADSKCLWNEKGERCFTLFAWLGQNSIIPIRMLALSACSKLDRACVLRIQCFTG
jgi:hypothetical protein